MHDSIIQYALINQETGKEITPQGLDRPDRIVYPWQMHRVQDDYFIIYAKQPKDVTSDGETPIEVFTPHLRTQTTIVKPDPDDGLFFELNGLVTNQRSFHWSLQQTLLRVEFELGTWKVKRFPKLRRDDEDRFLIYLETPKRIHVYHESELLKADEVNFVFTRVDDFIEYLQPREYLYNQYLFSKENVPEVLIQYTHVAEVTRYLEAKDNQTLAKLEKELTEVADAQKSKDSAYRQMATAYVNLKLDEYGASDRESSFPVCYQVLLALRDYQNQEINLPLAMQSRIGFTEYQSFVPNRKEGGAIERFGMDVGDFDYFGFYDNGLSKDAGEIRYSVEDVYLKRTERIPFNTQVSDQDHELHPNRHSFYFQFNIGNIPSYVDNEPLIYLWYKYVNESSEAEEEQGHHFILLFEDLFTLSTRHGYIDVQGYHLVGVAPVYTILSENAISNATLTVFPHDEFSIQLNRLSYLQGKDDNNVKEGSRDAEIQRFTQEVNQRFSELRHALARAYPEKELVNQANAVLDSLIADVRSLDEVLTTLKTDERKDSYKAKLDVLLHEEFEDMYSSMVNLLREDCDCNYTKTRESEAIRERIIKEVVQFKENIRDPFQLRIKDLNTTDELKFNQRSRSALLDISLKWNKFFEYFKHQHWINFPHVSFNPELGANISHNIHVQAIGGNPEHGTTAKGKLSPVGG